MTNTHNKNKEREIKVWSGCTQFKWSCYQFKIECNIYKMFYIGLIATKIEYLCWKKKRKKAIANKESYIQQNCPSKAKDKYFPRLTKVNVYHHCNYLRRNIKLSLSSWNKRSLVSKTKWYGSTKLTGTYKYIDKYGIVIL